MSLSFDPYSEKMNPSLYWQETFYRIVAAYYGYTLKDVPEEATHVAGDYLFREKKNIDGNFRREAEHLAKIFKQRKIDNVSLHNKQWWQKCTSKAPKGAEKVLAILERYQQKVNKDE